MDIDELNKDDTMDIVERNDYQEDPTLMSWTVGPGVQGYVNVNQVGAQNGNGSDNVNNSQHSLMVNNNGSSITVQFIFCNQDALI